MKKITKKLQAFVVVFALSLMTNCTTNEISDYKNADASKKAERWFNGHKNDYKAIILQYIKSLDWEKAIVSNGKDGEVIEVPFTLNDNLKTSNGTTTLRNDSHRLVFIKDGQQNFKTYYIQIFADDENLRSIDKSSAYHGVPNNFSGKIFKQDLNTNIVISSQYKEGKDARLGTTSKMREETYDCTYFGYWGEGGTFHIIKLLYCDGGSDTPTGGPTTGGSGGVSSTTPVTEDEAPPSCESFNFTSKKGANWQEAVVKNIYFRIIVLDNKGARVNHVVNFPQGVLFGMGINFNKGNGDVTPGAAATVSAMVLNKVMGEIDAKYARTDVSDLILRTEFQSRLIREYREYTNGGTVNFNTTSPIPATNYKTNPRQTGICDEN